MQALYEGLFRRDLQGRVVPAIAERYSVSADGRTYTFHLKPAKWSDGSDVTARDFAYAWKSVLDPKFPSLNADQLYLIKGAKAAKEGTASLETIGVAAIDDKTLVVELENPTPYFIELTATHFFFPVSRSWGESLEFPDRFDPGALPTNGPFKLAEWDGGGLKVVKNSRYHNAESVKLEQILYVEADAATALQMFLAGAVDWTGSPAGFIPSDAVASLKAEKRLESSDSASTTWLRFNTADRPLDSAKFRRTLSYALDRKSLTKHLLQGGEKPATGIIPPCFSLANTPYFEDSRAALLKRPEKLTLSYTNVERYHKIAQALQQQWREKLGINVALEASERTLFHDKIKRKDYQIALGNWVADIYDPINFLQLFKYRESPSNNTSWENSAYIGSLDASLKASGHEERAELLLKAETLLMEEMPVAPLFHNRFLYLKNPRLKDVYFSELGYLDFKRAYVD